MDLLFLVAAEERENQMDCYYYFQMRVADVLAEVHSSVVEARHHRYLHRTDYLHHLPVKKEGDFHLPLQKLLSVGLPCAAAAAVVAEMTAAVEVPSVQSQQADHSLLRHYYLQMD